MERNAAGDVVVSSSANMANNGTSYRFKVFFQSSPAASSVAPVATLTPRSLFAPATEDSAKNTSWVAERHQLTQVMVPCRGPLTEITLQQLAEQTMQRIGKRYPLLIDENEIESFDVIPLVWETGGTSSLGASQNQNRGQTGPSSQSTGGNERSSWILDASSAYRLDLAMNGLDELDFYFSLPSATIPAPPFELVIVWKSRFANQEPPMAPPPGVGIGFKQQRTSTPVQHHHGGRLSPLSQSPLPLPSHNTLLATSAATNNGGHAILPAAAVLPPSSSRPPLPPLPQRASTPSRLPVLEPRKPPDGAARYRQLSSSPSLQTSPNVAAIPNPNLGGGGGEVTTSSGDPVTLQNVTLRQGNESPFDQVVTNQPESPDETTRNTPQSAKGRRSITTFVSQEEIDAAVPVGGSREGSAPSAGRSGAGSVQRTFSPETESEVNMDEFYLFQFQLVQMTETEDRDTILLQQEMEIGMVLKEEQFDKMNFFQSAVVAEVGASARHQHAPLPLATSTNTTAMSSTTAAATLLTPTAANRHTGSQVLADSGARSLSSSPPVSHTTMKPVTNEVVSPAYSPMRPHPPVSDNAVPKAAAVSTNVPLRESHPVARSIVLTTSNSSVEAAALFAAAPTSQKAINALRLSGERALVNDDVARHADDDDDSPQGVEDEEMDEALLLACDELMNDWFSLRHQVLTEERKAFRAILTEHKNVQRLQFSDMTRTLRNEAIEQSLLYRSSNGTSSVPVSSPKKDTKSSSPLKSAAATSTSVASTREATSEVTHRDDQQRPVETPPESLGVEGPRSPPRQQQQQQHACPPPPPPAATQNNKKRIDDALLRLIKIVEVTEQADRREITDEEGRAQSVVTESEMLSRKRIQLRREHDLLMEERALLETERRLRGEVEEVEDRKFAMFAGLCRKGIQRILAAKTLDLANAEEL